MDTSNRTVLVVEDNAANMRLCTEILEARGCEVLQATHGLEGLQLAREQRPDVILMDMQLPDISGLDVTRRLKEDGDLRSIPVVAVTASAMKGDEEKYLQGGCDAYISKPISIPDFLETVEFFLDRSAQQALATG